MSEPTTTAAAEHHHPTIQPPYFPAAQGGPSTSSATSTALVRNYRKGNWTIQETLILITAKKLDEDRRIKPASTSLDPTTKGELRWKLVENYCWSHGCLRSSNQCNDKWDNLLREYKKVREYESNAQSKPDLPSYWNLEKHDRKLWNLPSNMALEVFQALNEALQRKYSTQTTALRDPQTLSVSPSPAPMGSPPVASERSESSGTEPSERHEESDDTKRKKHEKIGSSIKRSASLLAKTLQNCEEKKEKRHREIMEVQRRRLEIEEAQNEVKRQGMVNLVTAMSNLSSAIQSLISDPPHRDDQQPT